MYNLNTHIKTALYPFLFSLFICGTIGAQQFKIQNINSSLTVSGTSSLHDWEEVAETYSGNLSINLENAAILEKLTVTVKAESLKSGKGGMDKNTYKALKTDSYKDIVFTMKEVSDVVKKNDKDYSLKVTGNLTIAGERRLIELPLDMEINGGTVTLSGSKKMKMTDFKIDPPKALLGTITTGDEITIKFKTNAIQL